MRAFYLAYPICDAMRPELSRTKRRTSDRRGRAPSPPFLWWERHRWHEVLLPAYRWSHRRTISPQRTRRIAEVVRKGNHRLRRLRRFGRGRDGSIGYSFSVTVHGLRDTPNTSSKRKRVDLLRQSRVRSTRLRFELVLPGPWTVAVFRRASMKRDRPFRGHDFQTDLNFGNLHDAKRLGAGEADLGALAN
jgi:hypothetical protein